ncbi:hypothetical protein ES703_64478 [subsurface metagenome]
MPILFKKVNKYLSTYPYSFVKYPRAERVAEGVILPNQFPLSLTEMGITG